MQTATCIKTSVSIDSTNWQKLKENKNRSYVINSALKFFFNYEDQIQKYEKEYWGNVKKSLLNNNGDYVLINPNGESIDDNLLEKTLWK